MGLFDKLRKGLKKTRAALASGFSGLFRGKLDEDKIEEIEEALLTSDVGVATTDALIDALRDAWKGKEIETAEQALPFLKSRLVARMEGAGDSELNRSDSPPTVILVVGVNGSGKTTSIAKLAKYFRDQDKSVVLGAGDTFRAAAVEQLTIWSERLGVDIVKQATGADPAAVAYDAAEAAVGRKADVLIVDTAGRLHTQLNLMKELEKIRRVIAKRIEGAPHETLLVLDATTGQNALQQARMFHEAAPVTGLFLAKLDGTAKGGAVLSIRDELNLPVKFIGLGETPDDIEPFDAKAYVDALFS